MGTAQLLSLRNAEAAPLDAVPNLTVSEFRDSVIEGVEAGGRLAALFGGPRHDAALQLFAVVADAAEGTLSLVSTRVTGSYPALTPDCPQAHWFEREIAEQWGVRPAGHPWLKPIRFQAPSRGGPDPWPRRSDGAMAPAVTDFFRVSGDEVHEVAVGPVHAGIIEPGHFRFQCHGEQVLHLEIALGYQHRGIERALVGGPHKRTVHYMETLAGDTTVGHATAYCQAVEALSQCTVPPRAEALRGISLELERLANHTGDLGALAADVGYLPTASYCGRLRGEFLNMTATLCGSRFGRALVRPGGVGFDLDAGSALRLIDRLAIAMDDVRSAVNLLWDSPSVMARFEDTGTLTRVLCAELGLVGPAARACGVERDVRLEFPSGIFCFAQLPIATWHSGDVFARAYVRWLEIQRSAVFLQEQLASLADGPIRTELGGLAEERVVVSLVEGWRGEICHVAVTDDHGAFSCYKVVDPSFHNWMGLAMALRGQQISDFPLCNKSFNLSYCGHDL